MKRLASAILWLAVAVPASGEVLVFAGGEHYVEIEGTYEVKGRRVVYKEKDGKLCSVAVAEVDLPRSAALSAAQKLDDSAAFVGLAPVGAVQGQVELPPDTLPDWLRRTESGSALAWERFSECASAGDSVCTREVMSQHGGYIMRRLDVESKYLDRRIELAKARATNNVAGAIQKRE